MPKEEKNKKNFQDEKKDDWQSRADEYLAGWQRARADYENLQKQAVKEKSELIKNANFDFILSLLPVLDNFENANQHKPDFSSCEDEVKNLINQWMEGIDNVYRQMLDIFKQAGVEKIETTGRIFDPAEMEAVEQKQDEDKKDGEVIGEVMAGYKMDGRILRAARVIVNKNE